MLAKEKAGQNKRVTTVIWFCLTHRKTLFHPETIQQGPGLEFRGNHPERIVGR